MKLTRLSSILIFALVATSCADDDASTRKANAGNAWDLGDPSDLGAGDAGTDDAGGDHDLGTLPPPDLGDDLGGGDAAECGNGIVEAGEACDDGNASEEDFCLNDCTLACGDGVVNVSEICDTGIAADQDGACPTDCATDDACTMGTLQGTGCLAECVYGDITTCVSDDGCCAEGCNATTDNDCASNCGNGVVELGETCDPPGSCPTACDDADACTQNVLVGDVSTCDAACSYPAIATCVDDDGCCPSGCDSNNDNDCQTSCGNGVIEAGETCDPPGSCPTACDDNDACTQNVLVGDASNCDAECTYPPVTQCVADGCCAMGCDSSNDPDCSTSCGNGILESGETCDGDCPTLCEDFDACTENVLSGTASSCNAVCSFPAKTGCVADGCCVSGCDANNDPDCSPFCGNDVVEQGEVCDGNCPTTCDDLDACTDDVLSGDATTCDATCSYPAKTGCQADGCCVAGCNANNDPDCMSFCGNMIVEPGETCDDGNNDPNDGCDACATTGTVTPTAFLMTDLDLRDPHTFADLGFLGCQDITNTVFGADGVNPQFENAIQSDANGDGLLDLSLLTVFRPLDQSGNGGAVEFLEGECTAPIGSATCTPSTGGLGVSFTYTNQLMGTCLDVVAGTSRATYSPSIATPSGPCFVTDAQTIQLDLSGIVLTLNDARIGATYVGVPASSLSNGLVRGFLTVATAEAIILPASLPIVGGMTMAELLRGYPGNPAAGLAANCASGSDMDVHPTLGDGWWLYLNFPASEVSYSEP